MSRARSTLGAMVEAHDAGQAWADGLTVGAVFLGSMGEARKRYTDEAERKAFSLGAWIALQPVQLWTRHDDNTICKMVR